MLSQLRSPDGRALIDAATAALRDRPDRAAVLLRRHTEDAELATAALGQAALRAEATAKFGADAAAMFFTRDGLQQATRPAVADRRAARLAAAGVRSMADLCCGIGADAIAAARRGISVLAVDRDPDVAAVAEANAAELGLADLITVRVGDAADVGLSGVDAVFADPARRDRGARVFDPERYSPPLSALLAIADGAPSAAIKIGPGVPHRIVPDGAEAEWVSVDGDVVEATLWLGATARVPRRATVITTGGTAGHAAELTGSGTARAPLGELAGYLHEPDGAVIRSHLVAELADRIGAHVAHPDIAYLYSDTAADSPFASSFAIQEVWPFHVKRLRALLADRGIGRLTIKKRGADVVPDRLRRDLRLSGPNEATLIITRAADRHVALLCQPVP